MQTYVFLPMLLPRIKVDMIEAGCDEAGRGCFAGPVFAAAVIFPKNIHLPKIDDSKKLSKKNRDELRLLIEEAADDYAIATVKPQEIDEINILQASIKAMHLAIDQLTVKPEHLAIDGNQFRPHAEIPHTTVIQGDGKYMHIAAASILAKTYRDEFMEKLHEEYPNYDWMNNKGYPTPKHKLAIKKHGITPHHRKSFKLEEKQLSLW